MLLLLLLQVVIDAAAVEAWRGNWNGCCCYSVSFADNQLFLQQQQLSVMVGGESAAAMLLLLLSTQSVELLLHED